MNAARARARDEGTVLILVLVMIVVGSLLVLPLLNRTTSVLRANTVLSDKTRRLEAVKGGLRSALADPASLYNVCGAAGPTVSVALAPIQVGGMTVSSKCYFTDFETATASDQLRYGLVATQVGQVPTPALKGTTYTPANPASDVEWQSQITKKSETDKIWLPSLPLHSLSRRAPVGTPMLDGFPTCTVYFPGTYTDPVTVSGPSFFASGIYYFEDQVRFTSGADAVIGMGATEGCTTDQEAAYYTNPPPATHDITGLGATFIFGKNGRLVIDDAGGSNVKVVFNRRYVAPEYAVDDTSADVSIATVNGVLTSGSGGPASANLVIPGTLQVPRSETGTTTFEDAATKAYAPSLLTPVPTAPSAPTTVTATKYSTAVVVKWTAGSDGGSAITGYTVTGSPGGTCTTNGSTSCAITGLTNNTSYTFKVTATNSLGTSPDSAASTAVTPTPGSGSLTVPARPATPTVVPYAGKARVTWTPITTDPPVTGYTVTASTGGATCTVNAAVASPPSYCDVSGLDPATSYTFTVTATNVVGTSTPSLSSAAVVPASGLGNPPAAPATPPSVFQPTPVVEISLTKPAASASSVTIPGYIAVPQGRLKIDNSLGRNVRIAGGVLAAQFDVTDSRATGAGTVDIGFLESIVQRKFRIVSTSNKGSETSTAVVQVNQNGAYAVNTWEVQ